MPALPEGESPPVVLATGTTYADALPAGPLASPIQAPILLSNGPTLDAATAAYIGLRPVLPVGGPAYQAAGRVPNADGLPCDDLAGADRYATSADVAACVEALGHDFGLTPPAVMGVATGLNYPDALTGGALMGLLGGPLLLTDPNSLSPQTQVILANARPSLVGVELFGGPGALSVRVEQQVIAAVDGVEVPAAVSSGVPLVAGEPGAGDLTRAALAGVMAAVEAHGASPASRSALVTGARPLAR